MAREVLYVISDALDLASKNEPALLSALAPYLGVARKVRPAGRAAQPR